MKSPSSRQVKEETTGEGKEETIGQKDDLTADFGWNPLLQLREAHEWSGKLR